MKQIFLLALASLMFTFNSFATGPTNPVVTLNISVTINGTNGALLDFSTNLFKDNSNLLNQAVNTNTLWDATTNLVATGGGGGGNVSTNSEGDLHIVGEIEGDQYIRARQNLFAASNMFRVWNPTGGVPAMYLDWTGRSDATEGNSSGVTYMAHNISFCDHFDTNGLPVDNTNAFIISYSPQAITVTQSGDFPMRDAVTFFEYDGTSGATGLPLTRFAADFQLGDETQNPYWKWPLFSSAPNLGDMLPFTDGIQSVGSDTNHLKSVFLEDLTFGNATNAPTHTNEIWIQVHITGDTNDYRFKAVRN